MSEAMWASLLQSAANMAAPLLLAALGELVSERAGVVNIGIEGKLLAGAFAAMSVAYATGSPWAGIAAAAAAAAALAALAGYLMVVRAANQIVVGTAINLLAAGLTGVLYRAQFGVTGAALTVPGLEPLRVPILADLPIAGALFEQTWLGYAAFALVPTVSWFLFSTVAGLRLRAVGEDPAAAEAEGIAVRRIRVGAVIFCGVLSGLAGAYLAIVYARTFVEGMSAGRGFVALAIVVFGRWRPSGALAGALLFGVATGLQFQLQAMGLSVPYQFFLVLPYVLTLAILALAAGGAVAPGALGVPYPAESRA